MNQTQSLFERIGGMSAVNAAVDIFYIKVTNDDLVSHYFDKIDMAKQSGKLKAFLAYAFGAPMNYAGKNMNEAHAHMHITENQFGAVAGHLVDTLKELSVPQKLIDEVVEIALSVKDQIVSPSRIL